ncbi:MAG: vWA domain-containing protein [Planctomycetales bacterium]
MNGFLNLPAQSSTGTQRLAWELGRENWWMWGIGGLVLLGLCAWIYRRDTRELSPFWKIWLTGLRIAVWVGLFLIFLDPQERTETEVTRPSRVALLVDTSASMGFPEETAVLSEQGTTNGRSRTEAVISLLAKSPLLEELRKTHDVEIHTFDQHVKTRGHLPQLVKKAGPSGDEETIAAGSTAPDWKTWLTPAGLETRLGESMVQLIRDTGGETLSGIVVLSDGANNAGIEIPSAHEAALASNLRVITVGVGSTKKPINLQVQNVQAPTHAHLHDHFGINAFISAQGLAGKQVQVELLGKDESSAAAPVVLQQKSADILEDGVPVTVNFDVLPETPGRRMFNIRVRPPAGVQEFTTEDNEKPLPPIEMVERKTKVLMVAGGPMRDYQFVRNLLHRDRSIELNVWLQSGDPLISQESSKVLQEIPKTREELFQYDVILAFDPNWNKIPPATQQLISEWLFQQAGGMILVAGQVFTPTLASPRDDLKTVLAWYPVKLPGLYDADLVGSDFAQPWPVEFTREGQETDFLKLIDTKGTTSVDVWKQFAGIFRCFPSEGAKPGASVFAFHSDPRSRTEKGKPILLATQFFGAGRVLYLGSAEIWRLRALDENFYDRFWVNMLREVGQGRLLRGTNRGLLLLEKGTYPLGSSIPIRARLLDPQYRPVVADKQSLEIMDPRGRLIQPPIELVKNPLQPGEYQGAFNASLPGRYRLKMAVPQAVEEVMGYLQVQLPDFEYLHPEQDERGLKQLATAENGGLYLPIKEAAAKLPGLLPDRSQTKTQFDIPRPLWDRMWVMYLLVGLLSLEWLSRKLLKLS